MARESADEKIARVVKETVEGILAGQRDRDEEAKDPNWARMRKVIREEVTSVLGPLMEREGKGRTSRGEETDDNEREQSNPFSLFG